MSKNVSSLAITLHAFVMTTRHNICLQPARRANGTIVKLAQCILFFLNES